MDDQDRADIYQAWKEFDDKLIYHYEKESWKFMPKLDKLVKEKLGWRKSDPEDAFDRFQQFMIFVKDVYLRPSLGITHDCDWRDIDSSGSDTEPDPDPDTACNFEIRGQ